MYSLLVVDDEKYAAGIVAKGIDWKEINISKVYERYCSLDAMELFKTQAIDVLICDIEMPGSSGIQLQEWVRENYPSTETIFLTGHADFNYAQKAIQLNSFDYLLKPIDYDNLRDIVLKALEKVKKKKDSDQFYQNYKKYMKAWEIQLPVLVERFWQDLLGERILLSDNNLKHYFELFNMPVKLEDSILPILVDIDDWQEQPRTNDEEIMKYAVRNIAGEIFFKELKGVIIQDHVGNNLVLLYCEHNKPVPVSKIESLCNEFMSACKTYLKCSLSCFIGEESCLRQLAPIYRNLMDIETGKLTEVNRIIYQSSYRTALSPIYHVTPFSEWLILLETGKKEEIMYSIEQNLAVMEENNVSSEMIEAFFHTLVLAVYQICHRKGISIYEVFNSREFIEIGNRTRSFQQFKVWAFRTVSQLVDFLNEKGKNNSVVVDKIRAYIMDHISKEFSRDDIAAHVFLNPVYISRLFKKETGVTLSDYIIQARMEIAKDLLAKTNMKISDIAEKLCYYQFSNFTKMFKKVIGILPQEYRKKFRSY